MLTAASHTSSTSFKIGWWFLLLFSIGAAIMHAGLFFFVPGDELLFLGWVVFPLYEAVVLAIPYRRGEKWAWYITWLMVVAFALVLLYAEPELGPGYMAGAGLMAIAQLLTRPAFFSK